MNRNLIIGFALFVLFTACKNESSYSDEMMVDVSEFNMQNDILKDGDYVKVIGSSARIERSKEVDFYTLVVVKAEATGDTINVLLTGSYDQKLDDARTQFLSNTSDVGKVFDNIENKRILESTNVNDLKPKSFKKVFYNTEYIQIDVRQYPTVTGNFGHIYINEDSDFSK